LAALVRHQQAAAMAGLAAIPQWRQALKQYQQSRAAAVVVVLRCRRVVLVGQVAAVL
jgi:hypothetical protein